MITIKTQQEIADMRVSGKMLAEVLEVTAKQAVAGVSSKELAKIAADELRKLGGKPAFLGYQGFPDVICTSINEEVQHTIPGDRVLNEGDAINLDFGVSYNGMITDSGLTVGVGKISKDTQHLLSATQGALYSAMSVIKPGVRVADVSAVIEDALTEAKLGIVLELVGHGVGHKLHEDPEIPNYRTRGGQSVLQPGMTIAVEPIATLGSGKIRFHEDGWTITTQDDTYAAQFEHTLLVTDTGVEALTRRSDESI